MYVAPFVASNCTFFKFKLHSGHDQPIFIHHNNHTSTPNGDSVVLRRVLRLPWYGVSEQNSRLFIKGRIRSDLKGPTENILTLYLCYCLYVHGDTYKCKGLALKKSEETRFFIPR